jgi:hypothetical protein
MSGPPCASAAPAAVANASLLISSTCEGSVQTIGLLLLLLLLLNNATLAARSCKSGANDPLVRSASAAAFNATSKPTTTGATCAHHLHSNAGVASITAKKLHMHPNAVVGACSKLYTR